jgi:hypothetical protein
MATRKSSENTTIKVTTVAQASTVKLMKATEALSKIALELQTSNTSYEDLVRNVELKQSEMERLETQFSEKEREMEANLRLNAKESASTLVDSILKSENKVAIGTNDLKSIVDELDTLKVNYSKNMKTETDKAVAIISNRHTSELKTQELQFAAESANMKAELATTKDKLSALSTQVEDYKTQIKEDREARVEEARARGGQNLTIQSEKR